MRENIEHREECIVDLPKNLVFLLLWANYQVSQRKRCFTLPRVELPRAALTHVNLELVGGKGEDV